MFAKQDHFAIKGETGGIVNSLDGKPTRADIQFELLELEEITWGRREFQVEEFLREGNHISEIEIVHFGVEHVL